ncbi:phosphoric ester hydrolase [Niveomyces insectorum RCEF 264]|uniref:Phosphoric ester hydrolase n=1 Tax=Niveomyces insectorum RCEF 264 TaxID=1081102 RepID=A0A168A8V1_9HYPO|nr:phosphoric ester hydrolase [Niveomyces insectorum RCEF 264]
MSEPKRSSPAAALTPPTLLGRLGLGQRSPWDPPTVLDRLLASPVRAAAHYLWQWIAAARGWAAAVANRARHAPSPLSSSSSSSSSVVRVVCLSDTHDQIVPDVPGGDLLIHAGDLTNNGTPADLQRQLDWLASLPHEHKVVVCGNHDSWFDPAARVAAGMPAPRIPAGIHYLEHDTATLTFANGRRLTVYGAPDIPKCGPESFSWVLHLAVCCFQYTTAPSSPTFNSFQYERSSPPWQDTIPAGVDILVTHPPPRYHLDLGIGCAGLLQEVWRVRPKLNVFGHIHWGAGRQVVFWDASQRAYEVLMEADKADVGVRGLLSSLAALPGRLLNLGRLLATAVVTSLLLPLWLVAPTSRVGRTNGTVLINAGQMHGNTGRLGRNVQVVDL